jgi:predicted O-methyltransferase YrrM
MSMGLPWRPVLLAPGPVPAISTSVTEAETAKLQELAAQPGVTQILEVGSAFGYSAIAMALANPNAHITAVDPHNQLGSHPIAGGSREVMAGNLEAYGVADRVTMLVTTSQQVLPELEPASFDLVFIDADHVEPAVTHDVGWALKLLRPGGTLACHDLDEWTCPGVRAALDRLFDHPQPTVDTLFVHCT